MGLTNVPFHSMSLVEQELLTLPEHLSSPPVFSGVRVTRFLVLYVWFIDRCLYFCTFSFGHYVVCLSVIYGFWLPLWYLQTLLIHIISFQTYIIFYVGLNRMYSISISMSWPLHSTNPDIERVSTASTLHHKSHVVLVSRHDWPVLKGQWPLLTEGRISV